MTVASRFADDLPEPNRLLKVTPALEAIVVAAAAAVALTSWIVIHTQNTPGRLIAPPIVASLLVGNLVAGIALLMLVGRRVARRRAARSPVGGGGELHVRLVALFSIVAAVPMLLVAIVASLLFQYGVQFWYSDRARGMIENATQLAQSSYLQTLDRWNGEALAMSGDLSTELRAVTINSPTFSEYFGRQVYQRSLNEAAIYAVTPENGIQTLALVNPYDRDLSTLIDRAKIATLRGGQQSVVNVSRDRIQIVTPMPGTGNLYLYAGRQTDGGAMTAQTERAAAVLADYRALLVRARRLQLQFNAALLLISLVIVGIAVWIALALADRLVRPVGELVDAARRVAGGDLTARVPDPRSRDEVGTLARAFNRMTGRLHEQNQALVAVNDQLDSRRALIEAVMAGVSAGVVATGADGTIHSANAPAARLLGADAHGIVGRTLADIAPELDALVAEDAKEAVVQVGGQGEARTLAVRLARTDAGPILTFDDITQQVLDQRRAAWSDVARRIAHEIKNPLTPIQLAAERLQRRYGGKIDAGDTVFAQLTDTIVRQVGDLRRMVDEFSSFARMPKPVFREEMLADTARQVMFLHEVAHPRIRFTLAHDDPGPVAVIDRRQLAQALTNIVKNAVEAIEARGGEGAILMTLAGPDTGAGAGAVTITIADDGVGLPAERERIVEPYMTTRARGTGLGLAIVKKIVEEHHGTLTFTDNPGGGTIVTLTLDVDQLSLHDTGGNSAEPAGEGQLATLSRNRT